MEKTKAKSAREPLFHIVKRTDIPKWKAWVIRILAVLAALVVCGIIIVALTGKNPFEMYKFMFEGSFKTERKFWKMLQDLAMLLCVALAVTPAFKMRFWNIGAEGQILMGGLGAAICMKLLGDDGAQLSNGLLLPITIITAILFGAIWGVIPAFFKANWNTNETLFTLMMNYIAIQVIAYFTFIWSSGSNTVGKINAESHAGWLQLPREVDKYGYLLNVIIVALLTILMYLYLKYSKQGYEISVVGESVNTARYVGINVKKVVVRTMLISGALCGVAGLLLVSGTDQSITAETAGGRGYTAIMVSWLAQFNPFYMILTAFIVVFLQRGADELQTQTNRIINADFADILIAIIIFFIIGCEFFINYSIKFRSRKKKEVEA